MLNLKDVKRIWFISDIHFGIKSNSLDRIQIHREYFENFFIPLLMKYKTDNDILFVLGDIFDNRQTINVMTQNFAMDMFKKISDIIPIYTLIGNHDIYYKNTNEINSIRILQPFMTKIYKEPDCVNIGGTNFLILPWVEDKNKELDIINEYIEQCNCEYILCHTEIQNFKYNFFRNCDSGIDTNKLSKKFKKIISGHIHINQKRDKVLFIGSPLSFDRGDIGNKKGIYNLDITTGEINYHPNDFSPEYRNLSLQELLNMDVNEFYQFIHNNFVDIKIPSQFANIFPIQKVLDISENRCRNLRFDIINMYMMNGIDFMSEDINSTDFNVLNLLKQYIIKLEYTKDVRTNMYKKIKKMYQQVQEESDENS